MSTASARQANKVTGVYVVEKESVIIRFSINEMDNTGESDKYLPVNKTTTSHCGLFQN